MAQQRVLQVLLAGILVFFPFRAFTAESCTLDISPSNEIIAFAPDVMNWSDAQAYCASKGGRLPRIGNKNTLESIPEGIAVEGIGARNAQWPSGLPRGAYWTDTEFSDRTNAWGVHDVGDAVDFILGSKSDLCLRVLCVRFKKTVLPVSARTRAW
jgi:hypothetical protein